ncbi:unnamed protein product [Hermetia illucens]|uniref:ascorbate ferrireductase (transmembrane) n=2 Tax=Hermetia illucens TaxID=343691 RepID=A0A7R8USN7_HERIL|nr:unnamed protein product [Hermetia illucens]
MTLHAWLCTIGYNLLLAESILCFYPANVWTDMYSVRAKTGVHWFLHVVGSGMGLAGAILMIVHEKGQFHSTVHAVFGFIASFLLFFNLVTSVAAFFHHCRGRKLHPFTHTALQNFIYSSFMAGMLSQCLGYYYMESVDEILIRLMISFTAITLVLTVLEYTVSYVKQCHTPVEDLEL